jgi:hypothetical protein
MTVGAERIVDLVRATELSRASAIELVEAWGNKRAEIAALVGHDLAYSQILAMIEHNPEEATQ